MSTADEKSTAGTALLAIETILQSRYRVTRHLGQGGMGAVYEAIDLRLGHVVALKQTLTNDEDQWKQFEREARLLAWLNHPALPRVSDYFTEGHRAFFVMQFVEGRDLAEIIAQQPGPLPRNAVIAWADQLLDALIYLHTHERQIVHRDIKPHNLKITARGQIVLLDFGLAKTQTADPESDISCTSVFGYTPRYAPLEQIQDLGTSPQSDIYALGATLYHLLTGVKPPDALTRATALVSARPNPLKPADEVVAAVGPVLAAILTRAMAQNPDDRYGTAAEFREALRQVGRVEDTNIEYVSKQPEIESAVVAMADLAVVRPAEMVSGGRLGSGGLAAVFVILLAAFAIFCSYYPWKIPAKPAEPAGASTLAVTGTEDKAGRAAPIVRSRNEKSTDHDRRLKSSSKTGRSSDRLPIAVLNGPNTD